MRGVFVRRFTTWLVLVGAALLGFTAAVIVLFNVHIAVGLEQGYAATPAQVWDHSVLLAILDVLLLIVGPVAGVVIGLRLTRGDPSRRSQGERCEEVRTRSR